MVVNSLSNNMIIIFEFQVFLWLISCVAVCSLPCGQNRSGLSTCLDLGTNKTSSDDILQFIHRNGYMIVPQSNPPTQGKGSNTKRSIFSGKCPFTYTLTDLVDTEPRFLGYTTYSGCDVRCKPVLYTVKVLRRKCSAYWLWEEHDIQVAYILEIQIARISCKQVRQQR